MAQDPSPAAQPNIVSVGSPPPVQSPASATRPRKRHFVVLGTFLMFVVIPVLIAASYLWFRAADQYASRVGFSVRTEEAASAIEILGGISALSGSSSSDTDILYEFIRSQNLVIEMEEAIDLRTLWSKPENDFVFSFDPNGSIEDLLDYWRRMVSVSYDNSTSLIEIEVRAFAPQDATRIANVLFEKSSEMINDLSAIAREDAIRYSRIELEKSVERLKTAREAVTKFRNANRMVDPEVDIQTQAGVMGSLESQLAAALIELDLLKEDVSLNDPRLVQAERRVRVIQERIEEERGSMGAGAANGAAFADIVGEYERLSVDREFAERSYIAALASYDVSLGEANRKSRYLAAYVKPTTAETARYPERGMLLGVVSLFLILGWASAVLVAYSLKDRR